MSNSNKATTNPSMIKIVYFDEESASDLLEIVAGGKETSSKETTKEKEAGVDAEVESKAAAKFNWLPFFGGSAGFSAVANASTVGRSIINKSLSNTILTNYMEMTTSLKGIKVLNGMAVSARKDSAAYLKMYTPYMGLFQNGELPINISQMDEVLLAAKGYYELIGQDSNDEKVVLRFNINAFRNNYGLRDLSRMNLVFHGIRVGEATESSLSMEAEMGSGTTETRAAALTIADGISDQGDPFLDVYDVVLAGVEYE